MGEQPVYMVKPTFELFYRDQYPGVVGLVYALTGSGSGAEDMAQEAFLRAHRSWDQVASHPNPAGWVRTVALNLSRSAFRRRAAETRALMRLRVLTPTVFPELDPPNVRFWQAVRALPRRQREVVALHYLEDMAVTDVAEVLGIAESTVKNSLAQARVTLAKKLEVEV
jgi:RNA polymerase sigma-70 factor (ECF subfamily)